MPTYEYKCPTCQKHVDIIHTFADTTKHKCDNCKVPMVKVFAAPGLTFKGNGWGHQA